ncbi:sugar ABC transporter ATP-binding protein [Inquilinus sp. OTU3971]|uniref:sugar ABC transporter ATP-binding protein n=1 Tax=Inquilinus sp. OTU3971 TaxID=3043855 RepID=UPI00313E3681
MTESPFILEALAIEKRFGATPVLKQADLRVGRGEIHALLGGNGAGKSTLIRIVSGSHRRDGGTIRVDGQEDYDAAAIAVVFQELALLPHLSVAENIALPHRKRGLGLVRPGTDEAQAAAALALIDDTLAGDALTRPVAEFDLHQRQFVEIARALSSGARLLLLDEPTANLTFAETERLFGILRRLAGQGISTLIVSHRMSEIRAVADVCTILRDGRTVVDRTPVAELSDDAIVEAMGQGVGPGRSRVAASAATADGATVEISAPGVSLRLPPGSILGLAGAPLGPSALMDALIGAVPSATWTIGIDGVPARFTSPAQAVRSGVGYVSGDRAGKGILAALPILDNIVAAARVAGRRLLARGQEAVTAQAALDRLSIKAGSVDALPQTLSGGTQQKLLLARWLERPPRILVLEEPTRGVDIGTKREIYAIIRQAAAAGTVVVWWSTEFTELAEVCGRIVAFDLRGEVSGVLSGGQVNEVVLAQATGMAA